MDISRIIEMASAQGKSQAYLCRVLGKYRGYLRDVGASKFEMSWDNLVIMGFKRPEVRIFSPRPQKSP